MMTITTHKDVANKTLTFVVELDACAERVWELWRDPRSLEKWWGPPQWPATFTSYDFGPGGDVRYHMTGPDGEKAFGWWKISEIEPLHRLTFVDGFGDENGVPDDEMPAIGTEMTLASLASDRTRMTITSRFESQQALAQVLEMGMEEGMTAALGQIEQLLEPAPAG